MTRAKDTFLNIIPNDNKWLLLCNTIIIEVETKKPEVTKGNTIWKMNNLLKDQKSIVTSVKWQIKPDDDINARSGVYFLRTSLTTQN